MITRTHLHHIHRDEPSRQGVTVPPPSKPKRTPRQRLVLMIAILLGLGVILYTAGSVVFMMGTKSNATFSSISSKVSR